MAMIFFSYSHVDENLRNQLEIHLSTLKRQGLIETWHDRRIIAGDEFDTAISDNMDKADVILLLVSADFIASDYCYSKEMARALERHHAGECRVIPVILRPCDWKHTPLAKLTGVPTDNRAITSWPSIDDALLNVTGQIRAAVEQRNKSSKGSTPAAINQSRTQIHAMPARQAMAQPARSSNLRLTKEFSDLDRDEFIHQSFDFIAKYFEASLNELSARNPGIEGRYRGIDGGSFSAHIYKQGKAIAQCAIWIGGMMSRSQSLSFSYNANARSGSSNEMLSVEVDSQSMYFKSLGLRSFSKQQDERLSEQGAAELFWGMLIEPLQR